MIVGLGVLNDVHAIVIEVSENGVVFQLLVGDACGLDGVIGFHPFFHNHFVFFV